MEAPASLLQGMLLHRLASTATPSLQVRNSLEGWSAGRSIPGYEKNVSKPHLRRHFCRHASIAAICGHSVHEQHSEHEWIKRQSFGSLWLALWAAVLLRVAMSQFVLLCTFPGLSQQPPAARSAPCGGLPGAASRASRLLGQVRGGSCRPPARHAAHQDVHAVQVRPGCVASLASAFPWLR